MKEKIAEAIGELKFGQVGVANLKLRVVDAEGLRAELAEKVAAAPQLFSRTPLVVDLSRLSESPTSSQVREILAAVRAAGMLPVGLSYGSAENEILARAVDLPLFAKFRAAFESGGVEAGPARDPGTAVAAGPTPAKEPGAIGQHHAEPVRSGQQVYARGRDLILTAMVGNGAEVIADGSIHVYGALRGRALAGAQGDTGARIFCQKFEAELISIAGQYRVFEDIPPDLHGKPVQAWLAGDKLHLSRLL